MKALLLLFTERVSTLATAYMTPAVRKQREKHWLEAGPDCSPAGLPPQGPLLPVRPHLLKVLNQLPAVNQVFKRMDQRGLSNSQTKTHSSGKLKKLLL